MFREPCHIWRLVLQKSRVQALRPNTTEQMRMELNTECQNTLLQLGSSRYVSNFNAVFIKHIENWPSKSMQAEQYSYCKKVWRQSWFAYWVSYRHRSPQMPWVFICEKCVYCCLILIDFYITNNMAWESKHLRSLIIVKPKSKFFFIFINISLCVNLLNLFWSWLLLQARWCFVIDSICWFKYCVYFNSIKTSLRCDRHLTFDPVT